MSQRLFIYMYSLAYPAVLGSFLFAAITRTDLGVQQACVAVLMGIYFHVQYSEGVVAATPDGASGVVSYEPARFIQDLLEVMALIAVFASLGFFEAPAAGGEASATWLAPLIGWHWIVMIVAFAIPLAGRAIRTKMAWSRPSKRESKIGCELSVLSWGAIVGCVFAQTLDPYGGLILVGGALLLYLANYVLA